MHSDETKLLKVGDKVIHNNTGIEATIVAIDAEGVTVLRDKYLKKHKPTKNSWKVLINNWRRAPKAK